MSTDLSLLEHPNEKDNEFLIQLKKDATCVTFGRCQPPPTTKSLIEAFILIPAACG